MTNKNKQIGLAILLLSAVLFAVPLKAQVTIGDQSTPDPDAVLDLRSNLKLGLLLPRLPLQATTSFSPMSAHVAGMVVYNTATAGDVTPGFYYDDGTQWVRVSAATGGTDADAIVGNEVTDAADITLTRTGTGTTADPYLLARAAITGDVSIPVASNTATVNAIKGQTLPATAPTSGQTLVSDGAGALTWQTPAAGSSRLMVKTVTTSPYNITVADDNYLIVTPNGNVTFNFPTLTAADAGIQVIIYNSSSALIPNTYLTPENTANANPANAGTFVWTGSAWVAVSKQ